MDRIVDYTYKTPNNLELMKRLKNDPDKYVVWVDNDVIRASQKLSKEQMAGLDKRQIELLQDDLNERGECYEFDVWSDEMIVFLLCYMGLDGQHV